MSIFFSHSPRSLQSEQSGSEISLDESSQNNTVIPNEVDDEEMDDIALGNELNESTDVYETPITTIENITIDFSSVSETDETKSRRMKTERSNTTTATITNNNNNNTTIDDDMDDYEMQEKLMMNFQSDTAATATAVAANDSSVSKQPVSRSPTNESKLKSLKHRELEKQQEDDTNQSNV